MVTLGSSLRAHRSSGRLLQSPEIHGTKNIQPYHGGKVTNGAVILNLVNIRIGLPVEMRLAVDFLSAIPEVDDIPCAFQITSADTDTTTNK